ncbi:MAG: HNH endonuclease signature motif containing protein [Polaribacter sp.]|uniref:HNH endonuclease signature motif containing protein n=1 Tax=Polaribacter sp. TaxID=1920175 RepID=UPI00321BFF8D
MEIKNYLGYDVYSDGRIKSNGKRKVFLKGYDTGRGYNVVKLNNKNFYRHKVISECFLGKRPLGFTVNHIDGNKLNNKISNLEYITLKENYKHALDNNLKKNIGYYLTEEDASDLIEFYYNTKYTMKQISEMFGFTCKGVISRLIKGNYSYSFKK